MTPFIHDVSANFPRREAEDIKDLNFYSRASLALIKEELCYDYRSKPPRTLLDDTIEMAKRYSIDDLFKAVDERDGPLMLELVLRYAIAPCVVN